MQGSTPSSSPPELAADEIPADWTFESAAIAAKFNDHVREQLSWYDACSRYVADLAVSFLPPAGVLIDVGASTGNITSLLAGEIVAKCAHAISLEPSAEMAAKWAGFGELFKVKAEAFDFSDAQPDVVVMMLTLMFMPTATRTEFLGRVFDALNPGGAVIIVDKGFLQVPAVQVASKAATAAEKRRAGAPADAYVAKELSLRGTQRPTDLDLIGNLASEHGLAGELVFRHGEFFGILLVKRTI